MQQLEQFCYVKGNNEYAEYLLNRFSDKHMILIFSHCYHDILLLNNCICIHSIIMTNNKKTSWVQNNDSGDIYEECLKLHFLQPRAGHWRQGTAKVGGDVTFLGPHQFRLKIRNYINVSQLKIVIIQTKIAKKKM